jgi:hypothetical protein
MQVLRYVLSNNLAALQRINETIYTCDKEFSSTIIFWKTLGGWGGGVGGGVGEGGEYSETAPREKKSGHPCYILLCCFS